MHVKGDSCCLAGFRSNGKLISLYLCVTSIHILDVSPGSLLSTVIQLLWRNMDSSVPILAVNLQLRKRSVCSPVKLRCHWLTALLDWSPSLTACPSKSQQTLGELHLLLLALQHFFFSHYSDALMGWTHAWLLCELLCCCPITPLRFGSHMPSRQSRFLDEIGQLCFTWHYVINLLLRWQE